MSLWAGPKDSFGPAHDPPLRQGTRQDSRSKGSSSRLQPRVTTAISHLRGQTRAVRVPLTLQVGRQLQETGEVGVLHRGSGV